MVSLTWVLKFKTGFIFLLVKLTRLVRATLNLLKIPQLPFIIDLYVYWVKNLMFFFTADCPEYNNTNTDQVHFISINNQSVKTVCKSDGWTVIQSRGQFPSFPKDYFSTKTWKEYQDGFGTPGLKYYRILI